MLRDVIKPYFQVYSNVKEGKFMSFENICTFCKAFGLYPETITK
jgi:hypothetical protein